MISLIDEVGRLKVVFLSENLSLNPIFVSNIMKVNYMIAADAPMPGWTWDLQ